MKCPRCGAENPEGSAFCDLCLLKFTSTGVPQVEGVAPDQEYPGGNPPPPEYGPLYEDSLNPPAEQVQSTLYEDSYAAPVGQDYGTAYQNTYSPPVYQELPTIPASDKPAWPIYVGIALIMIALMGIAAFFIYKLVSETGDNIKDLSSGLFLEYSGESEIPPVEEGHVPSPARIKKYRGTRLSESAGRAALISRGKPTACPAKPSLSWVQELGLR